MLNILYKHIYIYTSIGPEFSSQYPLWDAHNHLKMQVERYLMPLVSVGAFIHECIPTHRHMCTKIIKL